jgi:erythromycin esterase-like protein
MKSCFGFNSRSSKEFYQSPEFQKYSQTLTLPEDEYSMCVTGIDAVRMSIEDHAAEFVANVSEDEIEEAKLALDGLNAHEMSYYYFKTNLALAISVSDEAMFGRFESLRGRLFPSKKAIFIGHNGHVGSNVGSTDSVYYGANFMGERLTRKYGKDYFPIALAGYIVHSTWPVCPEPPVPTASNAIEVMLHQFGRPFLFVDVENTALISSGANYQLNFDGSAVRVDLRSNFRGIFYLDEASALPAFAKR